MMPLDVALNYADRALRIIINTGLSTNELLPWLAQKDRTPRAARAGWRSPAPPRPAAARLDPAVRTIEGGDWIPVQGEPNDHGATLARWIPHIQMADVFATSASDANSAAADLYYYLGPHMLLSQRTPASPFATAAAVPSSIATPAPATADAATAPAVGVMAA